MLGRFVKRLEARMEEGDKDYSTIPYGMSIRTNYAQLMEWVLRLQITCGKIEQDEKPGSK
jgi:hypothetical protein